MSLFTIAIFAISFITIFLLTFYFIQNHRHITQMKKKLSTTQMQLETATKKQHVLATELNELKEKYTQNVLYDPLTELPRRQIFEDRLTQTVHQGERYHLTFAVLFLDIDGFKVINDALGHDVGDELLRQVALRLKDTIRQVDSISHFGSDEFVVILPLAKAETAAYVAQRLLNVIAEPLQIFNNELFITTSIGISIFPADGNETKTLLANAGNALHQAKKQGRNTYQFFHADMQTVSKRQLKLDSCLQNTAVYQEFFIYYQPQVHSKTKKIIGMQVLLHWQHPEFGLIPMHEFLPIAENVGKINEIGEWLLRSVLQQLQKWQKMGFYSGFISVPVSIKQLESPHFTYKVSHILQEMKLNPVSLMLEISEGILINKLGIIENSVYILKQLGVQIAIVDFGTGHLSLQDLQRFTIDYLKISSTLIQEITTNKENEAIINMIIALANSLHITIVAEGVETEEQAKRLEALGCFVMQGKLFGEPRQAEDFNTSLIEGFHSE